jgi:hypothetical protein
MLEDCVYVGTTVCVCAIGFGGVAVRGVALLCAQSSCEVLQLLSAPKVGSGGDCVTCVLCTWPGNV